MSTRSKQGSILSLRLDFLFYSTATSPLHLHALINQPGFVSRFCLHPFCPNCLSKPHPQLTFFFHLPQLCRPGIRNNCCSDERSHVVLLFAPPPPPRKQAPRFSSPLLASPRHSPPPPSSQSGITVAFDHAEHPSSPSHGPI